MSSKQDTIEDFREQILNLKRPDRVTSKYIIEAELADLVVLVDQLATKRAVEELKKCRSAGTQPTIKNDKFYFDIGYAVEKRIAQLCLPNTKGTEE